MQTLFVHFNNHTNAPSCKGVSKKKLHRPSYTFAGIVDAAENTLWIGVAKCSPRDQFVKKVGRMKAEGRAKSSEALGIVFPPVVMEDKKMTTYFIEECKKLAV